MMYWVVVKDHSQYASPAERDAIDASLFVCRKDNNMETIIVAILGSGALSALISGIFNLINNSSKRRREIADQLILINHRLETIEANQAKAEKDQCRTQLLMMINDFPTERAEILELAKHYFADLKGNWFATPIFNQWLEEYQIGRPEWFKEDK